MRTNKLTPLGAPLFALGFLGASVWGQSDTHRTPTVPVLSNAHKEFLSRTARRTVRDVALGRENYKLSYVPGALDGVSVEVIVRMRQRGFLLATAAAPLAPIAMATRDAALTAAASLAKDFDLNLELANKLLIEIEVVGSPEALSIDKDWTRPRVIDPYVEPGLDGLVLLGRKAQHRFCPTELFTSDLVMADALHRWSQDTQSTQADLLKVKLMRFRTVHWYQPRTQADIVPLHRGLLIVEPAEVTRTGLDRVIKQLADYMMYRQRATGLFTYQYEPAKDRYSDDDNFVRQVGAASAMATYARVSKSPSAVASANLALKRQLLGVRAVPDTNDAAFVATPDGRNKLGVTALLCIAMASHPDAPLYSDARERLVRGMIKLQRPSGMFVTAFPPVVQFNAQDYFPGEALLALATHYATHPSAHILDAFDRALGFYHDYFAESPTPAFVPWQAQAFSLMAKLTKRKDFADFVFEQIDWLAEKQLTRENCPWPELRGGIAAHGGNRVGIATAAYLEGFADALDLARSTGDTKRAARYERIVRDATRFVMQLQIRPEEAYFIRSPRDAIGGMRTSPTLNLLRIDHCQHALAGLIKARRVLFLAHD